MPTTTELFSLLKKIGESAEGDSRNAASIAFFSSLSKTVDGIESAKADSEFREINHYYSDSKIYTVGFKRYINSATDIFRSNQNDSSKYVSIGRVFAGFRCGNKNYAERLKTHVLNLYRVQLYNKHIMLDKLENMLKIIKKKIGGCDIGIEQNMVKNTKAHIGRIMSRVSDAAIHAADTFLFSDTSKIPEKLVQSIETVRDGAVNLARYESIALCKMLNQKIVSASEFQIEKQNNGLFWLTNPGILTALTTMNSIAITTSGAASKLSPTPAIQTMSNTLHVAAAGMASAALIPAAPIAAFVTAYLASKLSKTEIVQYLNANSRLRQEFQEEMRSISSSTEKCSFWENESEYVQRHTEVGNLIKEYNEICSTKYDTVNNLCDYFRNAYQIICSDPILLDKNEISLSQKSLQKTRRTKSNVAKTKLRSRNARSMSRSRSISRTKTIAKYPRLSQASTPLYHKL